VNDWTTWEIVRHQVAIGGCVVDARNQPVVGAQVTITAMPKALRQKVDAASSATGLGGQLGREHYDQTVTDADGLYYFLDLPAGRYTLKGLDSQSGAQGEKTVSVSWSRDGNVKRARADLKLSKA
jgi:Carboxypeptidase regulatory-like domain